MDKITNLTSKLCSASQLIDQIFSVLISSSFVFFPNILEKWDSLT